jgi:ribulose bisphosphate carboxylase small subunit
MVVKGGEKLKLITRKQYKEIKKMDRQEMETFLAKIYHQGYQDGIEDENRADFRIQLVKVLENTKGVGAKTFDRIMKTVKEMGI